MAIPFLRQAEDELIRELGIDSCDDPPCVGGRNFNVIVLWSALVKERMKNLELQHGRTPAS